MKNTLDHLPEQKQHELQRAVEMIREECNPEMIILFGSYARGDWVEDLDPKTLQYRYQSDFDLLVIMKSQREADHVEQNKALSQRLLKTIHRTPISLIAEDIDFVNRRLRKSQYFYIDIQREGIMLYDSGQCQLAKPMEIPAKERQILAQKDFDFWFNSAEEFLIDFNAAFKRASYNKAAFYLHQATECLYSTCLLVFTRYKPSTHDLEKLGQRVASVEPQFLPIFPQGTPEEKERFELLRTAYVNARYKPSYTITQEQLEWLAERVVMLKALTEKLCGERIGAFYRP